MGQTHHNSNILRKWLVISIITLITSHINSQNESVHHVLIETNMGNMKIKLYNDTPNHRDNFLNLVSQKHFDGTLFYRVIENFVIQGGSSDSRNAAPGRRIGYGSSTKIISSEFVPGRFHKRGALCAPRQPEDVNHFRMSDVSQFYIVHGRVFTHEELDMLERRVNNPIRRKLREKYYDPHKEELDRLREENPRGFNELLREIRSNIDIEFNLSDHLIYTEKQREIYTTIGGLPDLDGDYTVFGEVIEGLDVIERIAKLATDDHDRPMQDVRITIKKL
ncbi:peptidylprolyl isomerase [Natronoflexus pectinivorans]|uniref:peptidylprolyl isomerase n=1 Tax=Natronoflexus pectinivorans TaxID=682526 RepID=A0A4R2GMP5_9BACT|nr:peptidylprolyl isomerase [Natronoflexus pectinivorans]TCO10564.1 peptidyl-prolyl cis-trans isomerase B (cyclophilin B) [Natronoflexus pectinivorans]